VSIEAKDDGSGGDNWSYKSCKAPVKSSPPTNQHQVYFTGRMPFLSPNQQCQSTEGKHFQTLCYILYNSITLANFKLLLLGFVQLDYFSGDHSRLGQVRLRSPKQESGKNLEPITIAVTQSTVKAAKQVPTFKHQ